jgi:hypothetical protein
MEAAEAEARAEAEAHDGGAHAALAHDGGAHDGGAHDGGAHDALAHDGGAHDAEVSAVLAGDQPGDLDPEREEPADDLVAAADDGDEGDEEVLDLTDDAVVATPVAAESRHGEAG